MNERLEEPTRKFQFSWRFAPGFRIRLQTARSGSISSQEFVMTLRMAFILWLGPLAAFIGAAPAGEERPDNGTAANPIVQPGLVHWHKDFSAACAAAKKSGRPVLLFQLMGRLDRQFC
jgi:hypothetical protein